MLFGFLFPKWLTTRQIKLLTTAMLVSIEGMPQSKVPPQLGITPIRTVQKIRLASSGGVKLQEQHLIVVIFNATIVKDGVTCKMSSPVLKSTTSI